MLNSQSENNEQTDLFQALCASAEEFPVDFDDAWQWIGYTRKDNALRALVAELENGVDYLLLFTEEHDCLGGFGHSKATKPRKYWLSLDGFKMFCMAAGTPKGKAVRRHFIEIEKAYRKLQAETIDPARIEAHVFHRDTVTPWADGNVEAFGWLLRLLEVTPPPAPTIAPAPTPIADGTKPKDYTEYLRTVQVQIKEVMVDDPKAAYYRDKWQELLDVASDQALNLHRMGLTLNKYIKMVDQLQDAAAESADLKAQLHILTLERDALLAAKTQAPAPSSNAFALPPGR